jgi:NAD(P)H-flavin reductase
MCEGVFLEISYMKTAALITAVTDDFLPSTKVCGLSAMEWLINSLFEAKTDRVAICGVETMMTDVRKNCTRLFAEVVLNLAKLNLTLWSTA